MMLGGLLIWAGHFIGLYLLASFADVAWGDAGAGRWAGLVFSLCCLASIVLLCLQAARRLRKDGEAPTEGFGLGIALAGGVIAGVGVVFQTLPLVAL